MNTKKLFLVVEDTKEEQGRAVDAIRRSLRAEKDKMLNSLSELILFSDVRAAVIVCSYMERAIEVLGTLKRMEYEEVGVITDLMMPRRAGNGASNPNGLGVIAACVRENLPVVLCSDIHHHDADYLSDILKILKESHPNQRIGMVIDSKNWDRAVSLL